MATLDQQEQQQLDVLKDAWDRWGNLVTWALIAVLGAYAAWNGWNYWQARQGAKAAVLYGQIERSVQGQDVDQMARALEDMKAHYGKTTYASYSALAAAKLFYDLGRKDQALDALNWAVDKTPNKGLQAIARLRLASIQLGDKDYDAAWATLSAKFPASFAGLVADRRGDVLMLQGKRDQAAAEYGRAYQQISAASGDYRQLIAIKLNALGVNPDQPADAKVSS